MDALGDISIVIYAIGGIFLVLILGIAIKKYMNSRKTPGERTAFLFLLMAISGIVFLIIYLIGIFLPVGPAQIIHRKLFYMVLITIPFLSVLFAVQTQFGNLLEKGRSFTLAGIITYIACLIIAGVFNVSSLWAHLLYYSIAVACLTPSISLWLKLIRLARADPTMDWVKFSYYLIGFGFLDSFYLHDFLVGVIYGTALDLVQTTTDLVDAILFVGLGIFIVMAQLRVAPPTK